MHAIQTEVTSHDARDALAEAGGLLSNTAEALTAAATAPQGVETEFEPSWSKDAPKGGRIVLNRMLKEQAGVPLFLAQAFIQSLRDVGYDSTTSALCEHVDNSIGAGAREVRVLFHQTGKKGAYVIDVAVVDDGRGMSSAVLKAATSFGGSMHFGDRRGIGRFGMGMKTAGLSMAKAVEIVSWQEQGAFWRMTLDTDAIGANRSNMIMLDDPDYLETLPSDLTAMLTVPMSFPKDASEQRLLSPPGTDLEEALGAHGTIVHMPSCDRLSSRTARTLVEDATKTFAHVYRREITKGLRLYVNNRRVAVSDPTLSMPTARHVNAPALEGVSSKTSRLFAARKAPVHLTPDSPVVHDVEIRVYALPIREWSKLPRKSLNEVGVYNDQVVSILRNDREVFVGQNPKIVRRHSTSNWLRIEIDFPGELDEAFGVAANKQGVRPKEHVFEAIRRAIADDVAAIHKDVESVQAQNALEKVGTGPVTAERKAQEADAFQSDRLDVTLTEAEQAQMDENLRGLAVGLRRENETDQEAFDRVKASKYIIAYKSDRYWPFFAAESRFGRLILTINTAHPFYARFYDPLLRLASAASAEGADGVEGEAGEAALVTRREGAELVTMLDLLLLSMARTQTIMGHDNQDASDLFENFRRSWSDALKTQMGRV